MGVIWAFFYNFKDKPESNNFAPLTLIIRANDEIPGRIIKPASLASNCSLSYTLLKINFVHTYSYNSAPLDTFTYVRIFNNKMYTVDDMVNFFFLQCRGHLGFNAPYRLHRAVNM